MVGLAFAVIAAMRIIQKLCSKIASNHVNGGSVFFRYGAYYHAAAALFSLITLTIVGFFGFNVPTLLSAFLSALLFAVDLFTGLEAMKGASLTVCTMFGLGGLVISCVFSIFMFDEPMSIAQAAGLVLFFVGAYLLTPQSKSSDDAEAQASLSSRISPRTWIMLIVNLLANGFIMLVQKYFSVKVKDGNVAMFSFLTFALDALILLLCALTVALGKRRNKDADKSSDGGGMKAIFGLSGQLIVCGALLAFALFVINLVVTELGKTVPAVILFPVSSAISIGLSVIIGQIAFKEKMTLRNFIGLVIGLAGIIVIGMLTPEFLAAH